MTVHSISADFNNADAEGQLRLNSIGTIRDLNRHGVKLHDGLRVIVHDEELEADAEVRFSQAEHLWVARIDWNAVRQVTR